MIRIDENTTIPDAWEELSPEQFEDTVELLDEFFRENLSVGDFRLNLLKKLTGYTPRKKTLQKFSEDDLQQMRENLYLLADQLKFPLRPRIENPEILDVLSPDLQNALKKLFPFDIYDPEWKKEITMIERFLKPEPEINLDIRKCPIPEINGHQGPVFDIDHYGVVTTDMLAAEYIDAYEFFHLFLNTREEKYLNCLVSALYRNDRKEYSTYNTQRNAPAFESVPMKTKRAVMVWFQSLLEYLSERSPFTILFKRKPRDDNGFSLGLGDTIYSIAGKGYGPKNQVEKFSLTDYYSVLLREVIEAVRSMKDMDMKMNEMEEKTGLSADIISQI